MHAPRSMHEQAAARSHSAWPRAFKLASTVALGASGAGLWRSFMAKYGTKFLIAHDAMRAILRERRCC